MVYRIRRLLRALLLSTVSITLCVLGVRGIRIPGGIEQYVVVGAGLGILDALFRKGMHSFHHRFSHRLRMSAPYLYGGISLLFCSRGGWVALTPVSLTDFSYGVFTSSVVLPGFAVALVSGILYESIRGRLYWLLKR